MGTIYDTVHTVSYILLDLRLALATLEHIYRSNSNVVYIFQTPCIVSFILAIAQNFSVSFSKRVEFHESRDKNRLLRSREKCSCTGAKDRPAMPVRRLFRVVRPTERISMASLSSCPWNDSDRFDKDVVVVVVVASTSVPNVRAYRDPPEKSRTRVRERHVPCEPPKPFHEGKEPSVVVDRA